MTFSYDDHFGHGINFLVVNCNDCGAHTISIDVDDRVFDLYRF